MQRSADRILVTHVGSLVRPKAIRDVMIARDHGTAYDEAAFERTLRECVADVVRRQTEVGVDVVSDGEYGKAGWVRYVAERMGGFVHRPRRPQDDDGNPAQVLREAKLFPEFYAAYLPIQYYDWQSPENTPLGKDGLSSIKQELVWECIGPITYKGERAVARDVANFKSALAQAPATEAFLPVAAPLSARGIWIDSYYRDHEKVVVALADALREEYRAIVDAGFLIQLDDAFLAHEYDRLLDEMPEREARKHMERCVEVLNYALSGIPEDRVRYHVCWGSWNVPHTTDIPLHKLADLILKVRAQAYAIEGANPRHEHEWQVWKDVKWPDGKILIPGIVTHSTNVVEHPELVAWRIKNFASVVGRENVIAGTDCGFAQSYNIARVHPSVQWAKLESLVAGAQLASGELWERRAA